MPREMSRNQRDVMVERKSDFLDIGSTAQAPGQRGENRSDLFSKECSSGCASYEERCQYLGNQACRIGVDVRISRSCDEHKAQYSYHKSDRNVPMVLHQTPPDLNLAGNLVDCPAIVARVISEDALRLDTSAVSGMLRVNLGNFR